MTIGEAKRIVALRGGTPREDDWDLARAADLLLKTICAVEEFCLSEIAAATRVIQPNRSLEDASEVDKRSRAVRASMQAVEQIITGDQP